jgi:hypothetical protein
VCRFRVGTNWRRTNKNRKQRPCWSVTKLASITFLSLVFSYWIDKPRFLTEGKLATVLIIPSSWGSQLGGHPARITVSVIVFMSFHMVLCRMALMVDGKSASTVYTIRKMSMMTCSSSTKLTCTESIKMSCVDSNIEPVFYRLIEIIIQLKLNYISNPYVKHPNKWLPVRTIDKCPFFFLLQEQIKLVEPIALHNKPVGSELV